MDICNFFRGVKGVWIIFGVFSKGGGKGVSDLQVDISIVRSGMLRSGFFTPYG